MVFKNSIKIIVVLVLLMQLTACIGTVVGAAVDTAIEVVKIPFKVGGAVIDVVTPDDLVEKVGVEAELSETEQDAVAIESEGL